MRRPRQIADLVLGRLSTRAARRALRRVRDEPEARRAYDLAVAALRHLEGRDHGVADFELELVGQRLFAGLDEQPRPLPWWRRRIAWSTAGLGVCVALALLVLRPADDADEFHVRGAGEPATLALAALCGAPGRGLPLAPALRDCPLDGNLVLAYRAGPSAPPWLTLFGVDAGGRALYYAPTPADPGVLAERGAWTAAPFSVSLAINHDPGDVRVFALLAARAATLDEIDAWSAALAALPSTDPGDPPWHLRLGPLSPGLCDEPDACASAELAFSVRSR